ncbi:cbb3-type cytochrome c oxidase subunit II [uncultured Imperialibacter sp.]|uniref:cbb3-type cytochrome c oxidase subunit II n=1 Tax=Imperialibacter sp. TaxID=2038411 RepID=UPI0030DC7A04|tara:strand:- start:13617 stop:14624 length:1008 start_codon:yes stop_codon:yes gene_type:complete
MFNFHKDHRTLINTALAGFLLLSLGIAVLPAYQMQDVEPLPSQPLLTEQQLKGLSIYISEGCVACHTQQVRSIEMDKMWGDRPSMPSDYYFSKQRMDIWRQSPSLLGSERTGPDLTNIGKRQPAEQWHLLHLYNPRTVVSESVMPAYPWLFETKDASEVSDNDVTVPVGKEFFNDASQQIVATEDALALIAYLQSLKQAELPGGTTPAFIASAKKAPANATAEQALDLPDGASLYTQTCAACHQATGKGLAGAFPPLAGSSIVNDANYELLVKIILQGYDARSEFGQMPAFASQLTNEQIAAIANHERNSWGNSAAKISAEDVKKIREMVTPAND